MIKHTFVKNWGNRIGFFSGAMGTELLKRGLKSGECPDSWNLIHPVEVEEVLRLYVEAGADIIKANTFCSNRLSLHEFGLEDQVRAINHAGIALARKAGGDKVLVAASIGPTGKTPGELFFEEAYGVYTEQIQAVVEAGADIIIIETMQDVYEAKIAAIAAGNFNLPVFCQLTFESGGHTLAGTDAETAVVVLQDLADVLGINCMSPEEMLPVAQEISRFAGVPLSFQPNAGRPEYLEGQTVFPMAAREFAGCMEAFVATGATFLGGCCGTTPEHIAELKKRLEGRVVARPEARSPHTGLVTCASRTRTVCIGRTPVVIGERINPTGKKKLSESLLSGDITELLRLGYEQAEKADLLDVNVSVPGSHERQNFSKAVRKLSELDLPLVLDATEPSVLEEGLRAFPGKAIINSVNGAESSLNTIIPLAVKYNAALICLTMDEQGIPGTAAERMAVLKKILEAGRAYGLGKNAFLVDTLVLSAATAEAKETLEGLRQVRGMGLRTVLGVSNVSFGLPERQEINRTFLAMALECGLDAAIINPCDEAVLKTFHAASGLSGRDPGFRNYLKICGPKEVSEKPGKQSPDTSDHCLYHAILKGKVWEVEALVREVLLERKPEEVLNHILTPAIHETGKRFERKEYYLINLLAAAEAFQIAAGLVAQKTSQLKADSQVREKIILATVRGDIHEIGKNMVAFFLKSHGYEVLDLGKDVAPEKILEAALQEHAAAVGLSALMTTTLPAMEESVYRLKQHTACKVAVGGAVVNASYASAIGADGYARDAFGAVKEFERILGR